MSSREVQEKITLGVPKNTQKRNSWAMNTFQKWIIARNGRRDVDEKMISTLDKLSIDGLNTWISYFVCEVRKVDGDFYPAKSLLSLVMGIQGWLKSQGKIVDFLNSIQFERLRCVLDAEMKSVSQKGIGIDRTHSDIITREMENKLWDKKILGDHNPTVLVRTLLYLNGKNFALRGGEEHRRLRFHPAQITLVQPQLAEPYLKYTEDASKTNQGGLRSRRISRKEVVHHANVSCPERCHVRLYKMYMDKSPKNQRDGAFYLQPLRNFSDDLWYSRNAMGHNSLSRVTKILLKEAGISGNFTNHSLRASAATTLFQSGVSEQAIMARTGHRSVEGMSYQTCISFAGFHMK